MNANYGFSQQQTIQAPKLKPSHILASWPRILQDAKGALSRIEEQVNGGEISAKDLEDFLFAARKLTAGADLLEAAYTAQFSEAGQIAAALEAETVPLPIYQKMVNIALRFRKLYIEAQKNAQEIADAWEASSTTDKEIFSLIFKNRANDHI